MASSAERDRMVAGEFYRADDPVLRAARIRTRHLLRRYNTTRPDEPRERQRLLHDLFGSLGEGAEIEPPFYCDYGTQIRVGHRFYLNFACVILDCAPVTIGDRVMCGPQCQIITATHPLDAETRRSGLELARPVRIGDDVWLGAGVIVCPGTTIGNGTVVGAGSIVTKDLPANVLAVGNPCRVVRHLDTAPIPRSA